MFDFGSPQAIGIEVATEQTVGTENPCPTYTRLFRRGSCLEEALEQLYIRNVAAAELTVVSAGCSIGAEPDSLLALHNKSTFGGRLALLGVDINESALEAARQGSYTIPHALYNEERLQEAVETLTTYGFTVEAASTALGAAGEKVAYVVNSSGVRAGNRVNFTEHDLAGEAPLDVAAGLVVANNVLYHLGPTRAKQAIRNLAGMLSENGVLSVGEDTLIEPIEWTGDIAGILTSEFDLQPVVRGVVGQPIMFARELAT